jgi:hypothetical protein
LEIISQWDDHTLGYAELAERLVNSWQVLKVDTH